MIVQKVLNWNEDSFCWRLCLLPWNINSKDKVKLQEDKDRFGKKMGYEVPAGQMQYDADYKETDQEGQCFLYLRGSRPR